MLGPKKVLLIAICQYPRGMAAERHFKLTVTPYMIGLIPYQFLWDFPYKSWSNLPLDQRLLYAARTPRNEAENARKIAEYNTRIPLDPSVEILSETDFNSDLGFNEISKEECLGIQRWNMYRRDDSNACGGRVTDVPVRPFRYRDLYSEIRFEILKLVLGREKRIFQWPPDRSADSSDGPVDVRIFSVCRKMHQEATMVFYEINTFAILINDLPLFIRKGTGTREPRPTSKIRNLHIFLSVSIRNDHFMERCDESPSRRDLIEPGLQKLCQALKVCRKNLVLTMIAGPEEWVLRLEELPKVRLEQRLATLLAPFLNTNGNGNGNVVLASQGPPRHWIGTPKQAQDE